MSHEGGHRHQRLQQLLQEEIESLLRDEVTDPRLEDVRCTRVELSVDYRSARVHYLVPEGRDAAGELAKIERAFERASAFMRARLGEALELKRVPQLNFKYDRDAAAEARAQAILGGPVPAAAVPPTPADDEEEEDDDDELPADDEE